MLAAGASFLALSAAPFWIEQGFSYSAMVGLKEADQIAARAAFACRADFAAGTVWIVLGVSAATRWLALRVTRGFGLWCFAVRSVLEHVAAVVICWVIEVAILRQDPLRFTIVSLATDWCGGVR